MPHGSGQHLRVTISSFPKDEKRRRQWLSIVPIKGKFSASSKICSLHFKVEDYKKDRPAHLTETACPYYSLQACGCDATNDCRQPAAVNNHGQDSKENEKAQQSKSGVETERPEKVLSYRLKTNLDFKTISLCCFCGEAKNNFLNVLDKPYVESNNTTLILNGRRIELDFNKDSTRKTVCLSCDTKLKDIQDFFKLVKDAQEKLRHSTTVNNLRTEDSYDDSECYNDCDDDNELHDDYEDRMDSKSDTKVKETYSKRKDYEIELDRFEKIKKRRISFDLNSSLPSSPCHNDGTKTLIGPAEIKHEVDDNSETDPPVEVLSDNTLNVYIKEEIDEITDDLDYEQSLEVQGDAEQRASDKCKAVGSTNTRVNQVCKAADSIGNLVREVKCSYSKRSRKLMK